MESTLESPYAFFDYLINVSVYENYRFLEDEQNRQGFKYRDFDGTLADYLGVPHLEELIISKNFVEQNLSHKMADSNEYIQYLGLLKTKLSILSETRAYQEFEFIKNYVEELQEHLGKYGGTIPKATIATIIPPLLGQ